MGPARRPVYSVSINADGNVTYDGNAHVRVTGRQQARIPVSRIAALLDTAEPLAFFSAIALECRRQSNTDFMSGQSALVCARLRKRSYERDRPVGTRLRPPFAVDYDGVFALLERALAGRKQ